MASSTNDLTIRAGDDYTYVVTWLPDGVATDLTGATADMRVAWSRYPATGNTRFAAGAVDFSTTDDTIEIDVEANTITVIMSDASTALMLAPEATYQLRVDIDGVKTTIASGRVTVLRSLLDG